MSLLILPRNIRLIISTEAAPLKKTSVLLLFLFYYIHTRLKIKTQINIRKNLF
jgi:hypothetical protein